MFLGIALTASVPTASAFQAKASLGTSASDALSQLSAAFSGGRVVQKVQLTGNASWYAGSLEDSGTVTLTASADGNSQMQLNLGATGQNTETQTGAGSDAVCQWAGSDGVAHELQAGNCWRPALWFLPALSLHPSLLPSNLRIVDHGMGPVGSDEKIYRHLQSQLIPNTKRLSSKIAADFMQKSITDLGLDQETLLPAALAYSVSPDNGAPVSIAVEIRYADYRTVDGVQIPFTIQRYVNGSLQLEIHLTSAQIN
jgi:hypothetical protein